VRIFYRFAEHADGVSSTAPINTNEAFFYALEAVPMFLAILSFAVIHPGRYLVGPESELPGLWSTLRVMCGARRKKDAVKSSGSEVELL